MPDVKGLSFCTGVKMASDSLVVMLYLHLPSHRGRKSSTGINFTVTDCQPI